jgi:hypothetical protein
MTVIGNTTATIVAGITIANRHPPSTGRSANISLARAPAAVSPRWNNYFIVRMTRNLLAATAAGDGILGGKLKPKADQTSALSRLLDPGRGGALESLISLVIAANPTTLPLTSLTGDNDMDTRISFPFFRM